RAGWIQEPVRRRERQNKSPFTLIFPFFTFDQPVIFITRQRGILPARDEGIHETMRVDSWLILEVFFDHRSGEQRTLGLISHPPKAAARWTVRKERVADIEPKYEP